MKKLLCVLLIFCLAGCSPAENLPETDITISGIETEKSEAAESYTEENIFRSPEELAEYFNKNPELLEYIEEEDGGTGICVPRNLPEKYELSMIRLSGSYVTYFYENGENPAETFLLEWAFKAPDAEKFLQNSLNFSSEEIAVRPGSYASPQFSAETGEQIGWKIIWTDEGFCFTAIVSGEIFESFKNGTDFVEKRIFG